MNDECWRDLLRAEHRGYYTRLSVEITFDQLKEWAESAGITTGWVKEIEDGNRKIYSIEPFRYQGRMLKTLNYHFGESEHRRIWYTILGRTLFVWFSKKEDAILFKLTFGGAV